MENIVKDGEEKYLIIVRGLSGSGKTKFVDSIALQSDIVVSAGDFMVNSKGEYFFDPSMIEEVHEKCQQVVETSMEKKCSHIFVHNVFATQADIAPYIELAERYGYKTFSIIVECRTYERDTGFVPPEVVGRQREKFDICL